MSEEDKKPSDTDIEQVNEHIRSLGQRSGKLLSIAVGVFVALTGVVVDILSEDGFLVSEAYEYIFICFMLVILALYKAGIVFHLLGMFYPSNVENWKDMKNSDFIDREKAINNLYIAYICILFSIIFLLFFVLAQEAYVVDIVIGSGFELRIDAFKSLPIRALYVLYTSLSLYLLFASINQRISSAYSDNENTEQNDEVEDEESKDKEKDESEGSNSLSRILLLISSLMFLIYIILVVA